MCSIGTVGSGGGSTSQRNRFPTSKGLVEGRANVLWIGLHELARLSIGRIELYNKEDPIALSGLLEQV
jgi:hypothetical protein